MRKLKVILFWPLMTLVYLMSKLFIALDRKFKFKLKFPAEIKQLKEQQDWCIQKLKESGAIPSSAEITGYSVEQLKQDLIFRSDTALLIVDYQLEEEKHQFKCIAKFSPTQGSNTSRAVYNIQQNARKEVGFYKNYAHKIKSPQIYFADVDKGTSNMCILMEYLAEYREYDELEGCPKHLLPVVIKNLAIMHATFWGTKNKEVESMAVIPPIVSDFLASSCWFKWSKLALNVFTQSWERNNVEQTIIHGDARVGNYMFHKTDNQDLVFIDWQATRISKGCVDLAYFLILSNQQPQRVEMEAEMLKLYYATLLENGVPNYSETNFRDDYNDACIMVLTMLAMPWLSGEGSLDKTTDSVKYFVVGYHYWYKRLKAKMDNFDFTWMSKHYKLSEEECEKVVQEMLTTYNRNYMILFESIYNSKAEAEADFEILEGKLIDYYIETGRELKG